MREGDKRRNCSRGKWNKVEKEERGRGDNGRECRRKEVWTKGKEGRTTSGTVSHS